MAIHPTAIVDSRAEIDGTVEIGPYAVVEANVRIAPGCSIGPHAYLTGWTTIEENCRIHVGAVIGHEPQDVKYGGEPTYCRIGRDSVLREYVTVHRGTTPESTTVVGEGCFLLAGSHVAHNCVVGNGVTLINDTLLGGHVTVGDRTVVGGGAAVHQFVRIGNLVMVAGNASVTQDVPPFALTDRQGRVAGLNRIGMRRANLSRDAISDVREAYKTIYAARTARAELGPLLRDNARTDAGRLVADFVAAPSSRTLAGRARSARQD
jgi:UDP-N-acetylglucosamine acyltransferase